MKTEQAIRKLGQTLWDILGREYIDKYCEDKNGNLVSVSSISVDEIAEELVNAGYGNIKQAQIDVLNKVKDIVFDYLGVKNIKEAEALSLLDSTLTYDVVTCGIDELIEEVEY